MNFSILWRKWIMECVTTPSTSVPVNGSPTNELKFEKGLRQGDPMPPFLFLIAIEGIIVLMKVSMKVGLVTRYSVDRSCSISISQIQFFVALYFWDSRVWRMFDPCSCSHYF